jgi:intracellular multiplication protein IcmD
MIRPLIEKIKLASLYILTMTPTLVWAGHHTVATVATSVTTQVDAVVKLLNITAYIAGVGFALSGILQFKTHKENPQQVPLSKPIIMILVAACLLFLPTVLTIAGNSMFGHNANSAATAGGSKNLSGH